MQSNWARLDNNGNLYPAVLSKSYTTIFRLSVSLFEAVQVDILNKALAVTIDKFPYYKVHLRPGAFWYTFVKNQRTPHIVIDSKYPCTFMPFKQRGVFPFRVRAWGNTIAVEFSHALTDGTGAMIFLKTLLADYYKERKGALSEADRRLFEADEQIRLGTSPYVEEEAEDAFRRYFDSDIPDSEGYLKAFRLPGKRKSTDQYGVLTADMPVAQLLNQAKMRGLSLTEYLVSVYFFALQEIQIRCMKRRPRKRWSPLSIMVPINLRPMLPSRTMRNFFLALSPHLDTRLGYYHFDEICPKVHHFLRSQLDYRNVKQDIRKNMRGVVHPLLRIAPLFVKNSVIRMVYRDQGEKAFSGNLSNLGVFSLPKPLNNLVKSVSFVPPPSPVLGIKCGVISYGDTLSITFGSLVEERLLEYHFLSFLRKAGIRPYLRGNWKGETNALLSPLRS
ncbi:hypothetical protein [Sediminispirochaeta bajacaliforniensis]|uniref:hypothetical protein n=1 Tax=Sediminispirochaeta bajacaliforniensis TaxID=148 RepID=UPI00037845F8|nr:hypothetical protein [Sediminispirochaeta bajacaliforniensis]